MRRLMRRAFEILLCTLRMPARLLKRPAIDPARWRWFRRALGAQWALCSVGGREWWFWFSSDVDVREHCIAWIWGLVRREHYGEEEL